MSIGIFAHMKSTGTSEDYRRGGRNAPPAIFALSAGASDMSGWSVVWPRSRWAWSPR